MAPVEDKVLAEGGEQGNLSTLADPTSKKGTMAFNSQTNYVPKTKRITVNPLRLKATLPVHALETDLPTT